MRKDNGIYLYKWSKPEKELMPSETSSKYVLWETFSAQIPFIFSMYEDSAPGSTTSSIRDITCTCQ